jgi:signal transduction histidine kinase
VDTPFTYYLVGGCCIGYIILLVVAARSSLQLGSLQRWLIGTLFVALVAQAVHFIPPNASEGPYASLFVGGLTQPAIAVFLTSLVLVAFTALTLHYLQRSGGIVLLGLGILWWLALFVVSFFVPNGAILGQPGWLGKVFTENPDPAGLAVVSGWAALGVLVLLVTSYSFYRAHLPEIANRALFWVVIIPLISMGAVLGTSGSGGLKEIGWGTQLIGMTGAVYGAITHRVFDIRRTLGLAMASTLVTAITALVVLIALIVGHDVDITAASGFLLLAGLAVATAIVYTPLRTIMRSITNRLFGGVSEDTSSALRQYSQDVSGVVEMDELVDVAMSALRNTLRVRRGGLILATRDDNDTIRVEPMAKGLGEIPGIRGWIPKDSPIYHTLYDQRTPLLQFDLEYARQYADVAPELKSFFKQLRMSAYAPIVVQGQLIGLLAAGAKSNDNPFYPQDLELLATVANQTGVALRNARLVSDLRTAGEETQALNQDLVATKERIEQLDAVKTDFITIASHELRTPLAQIRGYTDIIDALNEQSMLDPDQVAGMTSNLRKATDRLERLIGDMLDVSQLGLDAMDLRFAQTTIENILRLSIEPLTENIRQRKLTLVARGLKGLPPLEADMQRLVQAFRNVVTNAIKYTPDGGRIDITAHLQKNEHTGEDEIMVAIQDTGIGIDPKNHELIFEKFFRVSDPGLHSTGATKFMGAGPGLGLTIARGVIQGHGGKIWVESPGYDPEKLPGSTFYIVLPIVPPKEAVRVLPFESAGATAAAPVAAPAAEAPSETAAEAPAVASSPPNRADAGEDQEL